MPLAIEMSNITKTFPGLFKTVVANDRVSLSVDPGEIHVIVGENGAGKSTLMNVLYGMVEPDEGTIRIRGEEVSIDSPQDAISLGIGMIHQHFMLIPSFTIAENVILGDEPSQVTLVDQKKAQKAVLELANQLGFEIDPTLKIWDASVGVQQRVEILKALYRGAETLILDEPTAVLTPQEVEVLFEALETLSDQGTTIVLITHKLPEVMRIADHVTVLRDGKSVGQLSRGEFDKARLAEMMTGRSMSWDRFQHPKSQGQEVLTVKGLKGLDDRGLQSVNGISFSVKSGEILAIAGVAHNGQEELAEMITGQRPIQAGQVILDGQDVTGLPVRAIRELGLGHIPDDRYREGCAREASLYRNVLMGAHHRPPLSVKGVFQLKEADDMVENLVDEFSVKVDHPSMPMDSLSGGNVQKAIVAREMHMAKKCLIAEQPARGIDIGSSEFVYQKIMGFRDQGGAILLISTDLTEVMRLSDRILVIYKGEIVGQKNPEQTTQKDLGLLMAGVTQDDRDRSHE